MSRAATVYQEAAASPTFTSATLFHETVHVHVTQPDLKTGKTRAWTKTYGETPSFATPLPSDAIVSLCPDGTRMLVFTNPSPSIPGTKHATIEEWCPDGFVRTIVGPDDVGVPFGSVHPVGSTFGCLEWTAPHHECVSPPCLLFCAESKVSVTPSTTPWHGHEGDPSDSASAKMDEFAWRESWGEGHTEIVLPKLFVLNLESGSVQSALRPEILSSWSLGKGCWVTSVSEQESPKILFTAWPPGQRLGVKYCTNRPSQVFFSALGSDVLPTFVAGTTTFAAKAPIVTPAGDAVLYLLTKVGGPHCQSAKLVSRSWPPRMAWNSDAPKVIVDHGLLYGVELTSSMCWLDHHTLVLQTQHHSKSVLLEVKVKPPADPHPESDSHRILDSDPGLGIGDGSFRLLASGDGCIVAAFSNPSTKPVLLHWNMRTQNWKMLSRLQKVAIEHRILNLADSGHGRGEAILYTPPAVEGLPEASRPLIVWPHGGPHSMTDYVYNPYVASFVALGFVVVAPNYVGSAGYGDEPIIELASGNVGTLDVADVNGAADAVVAAELCSPTDIVAFGGSHGGFLTAHLSAQFPKRYKATVIRNPVIDIASMVGSSDIPSWCWTEVGLHYTPGAVPGGTELKKMHDASPLSRVDRVCAPSLVLIGLQDVRVPVSQGFLWHNALRARGVQTKVRTYPDDRHPLSSTKCAADVFVHSVAWFQEHLQGERSLLGPIVWVRVSDELQSSQLWPARIVPSSQNDTHSATRTVELFGDESQLTDVPLSDILDFAPHLSSHRDLVAEGAASGRPTFEIAVRLAEVALGVVASH
eukprot:m.464047 g.464047  ORF g.464047 m.464047 type:complete len:809 (-) comp23288_c0_seq1:29-2455(-)